MKHFDASLTIRSCVSLAAILMVSLVHVTHVEAGRRASIKHLWRTHTERPMVMAHRGDHRKAPENTLRAFRKAVEAGAHFVEVDVRLTIDNHWVVYHNRMIPDRGGTRRVLSSMPLAEVRTLPPYGAPYGNHEKIPTLDEVLTALDDKILIYLDDKMGRPLELADIVRAHDMEDQVVIGVGDYADAILMSEFAKDIAWRVRIRPRGNEITKYLRLGVKVLEVENVFVLDSEDIERIHRAGARIMVNCSGRTDSDSYYSIMVEKIGADIIQTDNLDKLIAFLQGRGARST